MEKKLGRYVGIVKRWDYVRGYGFLVMLKKNRSLTKDSLVYVNKVEVREEHKDLYDQQVVEFDLYENMINAEKVQYKAKELKQIRSGMKLFSDACRGSEF